MASFYHRGPLRPVLTGLSLTSAVLGYAVGSFFPVISYVLYGVSATSACIVMAEMGTDISEKLYSRNIKDSPSGRNAGDDPSAEQID